MHLESKSVALSIQIATTSLFAGAALPQIIYYVTTLLRSPRKLSAKRKSHPLVSNSSSITIHPQNRISPTEITLLLQTSELLPRTIPKSIFDMYTSMKIEFHTVKTGFFVLSESPFKFVPLENKPLQETARVRRTKKSLPQNKPLESLSSTQVEKKGIPVEPVQRNELEIMYNDNHDLSLQTSFIQPDMSELIDETKISNLPTTTMTTIMPDSAIILNGGCLSLPTEPIEIFLPSEKAFQDQSAAANKTRRAIKDEIYRTSLEMSHGKKPKMWAAQHSKINFAVPEAIKFVKNAFSHHKKKEETEDMENKRDEPQRSRMMSALDRVSNIGSQIFFDENKVPRIDLESAFGETKSVRFLDCEMANYASKLGYCNLVIKICILDSHGTVLFNELMNPWKVFPPGMQLKYNDNFCAQFIHKIKFDDIKNAPSPAHFVSVIKCLLDGTTVIGFDILSDMEALKKTKFNIDPFRLIDISSFKQFRSDSDQKVNLQFLSEQYCLGIPNHDPVKDARATALLYYMAKAHGWDREDGNDRILTLDPDL